MGHERWGERFFSFEYFWTPRHRRPSDQIVLRGVRLGRGAVSLGVVREACVSTGSCTERALVPSDFAHSAMLAVPTGGPAHEIVIVHHGLLRRTTDGPGTLALQHPPLRIMLSACCPTASYQGLLLGSSGNSGKRIRVAPCFGSGLEGDSGGAVSVDRKPAG